MNESSGPLVYPDWRDLLCLGEELLDYQSAATQSHFIHTTINQLLDASCEVWFASPFYPLPGDSEIFVLPADTAPSLVSESFNHRRMMMEAGGEISPLLVQSNPVRVAFPLITRQDLLAIMMVTRERGFSEPELELLEKLAGHWAVAMQVTRQAVIKNWRFDQLALVRSVSIQIANQRDLNTLCRQVTRLIQQTFDIYFVSIFSLDKPSGPLTFRASATSPDVSKKEIKFKVRLGEGIIGTVAKTGQEMLVADTTVEPLFRSIDALPDTLSEVVIPIRLGERILGVLDLQSNQRHHFHENELMVLRALADNIATAIEGTRLLKGLEKRADQISTILEISRALTSILDFEQLMGEIVNSIQKNLGYPFVHIFITHQGRRKLFYEAGSGARSQAFMEHKVAYDIDDPHGIIPYVARTGSTLLANDVTKEPLYRSSGLPPENTRSELAIPLAVGGQVLGVLDIQSNRFNGFEPRDVPLLEALSASVAIAIRNATLYRSETWRRKVTDSFRDIAGLVSANVALDELLDRILTELENILPCEVSAIWLVDEGASEQPDASRLKLAAVHGLSPEQINAAVTNEAARSLLESALETTEPTIRTTADPAGPLGVAAAYELDYSSVAVPMRAGERVLGVLAIAHPTPGRYGSDAGLVSMTLANNAAIAIQNNQLYASAQEQAWVSTVLLQIAEAAQADLSVEELLDTMARLTPLLIGVKQCAFFLWDGHALKFTLKSAYGMENLENIEIELDQELPAFRQLIDSSNAVFIQDVQTELGLAADGLSADSSTLVLLPLLSRTKLFGAYLVGYQREGEFYSSSEFDQQLLSLLQGIAQQTSVALENIQLLEARQEEAYVTAVLLQVAQAVVSQNALEDIFETIVHLMPILVGIDACAIYLWDPAEGIFQTAKVFTGSAKDDHELENKQYAPHEFPLLQAVFDNDIMSACRLDDPEYPARRWPEHDCFTPALDFNWTHVNSTNWILGVPLSLKGEKYGVLVAQETNVPLAFHERRLEILNGIAQQISLAIQNERLNLEMVEQERLEREIQLARQIQRTFLPSRLPDVDGWEIDIDWQTAHEVGGDFYDVFKLDKDRLGLVIADVSDKGMPAALYMTVTRTLIRAFVHHISSPAHVLERVNRLLVVDSQDGLFVTAIYAILNIKTGTLTYANAGHNLPLIVRGNSHDVESLQKGGMALGILANNKYEEHNLQIASSDSLVMYTDGVTECFNTAEEVYGVTRLVEALKSTRGNRTKELKSQLSSSLSEFRGTAPLSDDQTLVFLHRLADEQ